MSKKIPVFNKSTTTKKNRPYWGTFSKLKSSKISSYKYNNFLYGIKSDSNPDFDASPGKNILFMFSLFADNNKVLPKSYKKYSNIPANSPEQKNINNFLLGKVLQSLNKQKIVSSALSEKQIQAVLDLNEEENSLAIIPIAAIADTEENYKYTKINNKKHLWRIIFFIDYDELNKLVKFDITPGTEPAPAPEPDTDQKPAPVPAIPEPNKKEKAASSAPGEDYILELADSKNTLLTKFRSFEDFRYLNKFVYFKDDDNDIIYFFGSLPNISEISENSESIAILKAKTEGKAQGILKDSNETKVNFAFLHGSLDSKDNMRFIVVTTKTDIILYGDPRASFVTPSVVTSKNQKAPVSSIRAPSVTPSDKNISYQASTGAQIVLMRYNDLPSYKWLVTTLFSDLQERINFYDIQFRKPFSTEFLKRDLLSTKSSLSRLINTSGVPLDNNTFIKLAFDKNFSSLLSISVTNDQANFTQLTSTSLSNMTSETINFLIYNLFSMYNKYYYRILAAKPGQTVFESDEEIRDFLKKYFRPRPELRGSIYTKNLIEKFILGEKGTEGLENFLLDYQTVTPAKQISSQTKQNLDIQISKQYESIGDFLGNKFIAGEYKDINDIDDLYDQLLDHISVPDLVQLSATCLLKVVPLDKLLDSICKPILKKYDDHQAYIINELKDMDDGIAKDLSKELAQQYFKYIGVAVNKTIPYTMEAVGLTADWVKQMFEVRFWKNQEKLINLRKDLEKKVVSLINVLANNSGTGENSIRAAIGRIILRKEELLQSKIELQTKISLLAGAEIPENFLEEQKYYDNVLKQLDEKEKKLLEQNYNIEDQLIIYDSFFDSNSLSTNSALFSSLAPQLNELYSALNKNKSSLTTLQQGKIHQLFEIFSTLNPWVPQPATEQKELALKRFNQFKEYWAKLEFKSAAGEGNLKGNISKFDFPVDYAQLNSEKQWFYFHKNIECLEVVFGTIDKLLNLDSSPKDFVQSMTNFGENVLDAYVDELFKDPTKRLRLCLAIYAAVPAAAYMIYLLFKNYSAVWEYLKDGSALLYNDAKDYFTKSGQDIYNGFKKRLSILGRTDYPVNDILEAWGESLILLGKNLGRDLLLSGIMITLDYLRKLCSEQADKVNAPYKSLGAIDLSEFITSSAEKGTTNIPVGEIQNSTSFKALELDIPGFDTDDYQEILSALSESFSIFEMCSLLDGSASEETYLKAIEVLEEIIIIQFTPFFEKYVNPAGIRELFKIISKDIEPAFCAQAIDNFEREKLVLIDLCLSRDDTIMEDILCEDLSPAECLKLLSAKAQQGPELAGDLVNILGDLFKTNSVADPCSTGENSGFVDPSIAYSSNVVGDSIFSTFEKTFEADISKIKPIYGDRQKLLRSNTFSGNTMKKIFKASTGIIETNDDDTQAVAAETDSLKTDLVAVKIFENHKDDFEDPNFSFKRDKGSGTISLEKKISLSNDSKKISFLFNEESTSIVQLLNSFEEASAYFSKNNNFDFIKDPEDRKPENVVFGLQGIAAKEPDYSLSELMSYLSLEVDDYIVLLNATFKDLFASSFGTGLYKKEKFVKLNLERKIAVSCQESFLGFMNKKSLNVQLQNLASRLSCLGVESATKGPVNVAMIKMAFDCLVRVIAVKEMMKSLFVFGIFPSTLKLDSEANFYDQFIDESIEISVRQRFKGIYNDIDLNSFYNLVIRDFITDSMKILYQDSELSDFEAYKLLRDQQVEITKFQIRKSFETSFSGSQEFIKPSEYQVLNTAINSDGSSKDSYDTFKNVDISDKVQALQNDSFSRYFDSFIFSQQEFDFEGSSTSSSGRMNFDDSGIPTFTRIPSVETKYYNIEELQESESFSLGEILQGNNNGIVLEKMIQIKPKKSFFPENNLFSGENQKHFIDFLNFIGKKETLNSFNDPFLAGNLKDIKDFLYETRLIMLFPQLKKIIDSLGDTSSNPPWEEMIEKYGSIPFVPFFIINFGEEKDADKFLEIFLNQDYSNIVDFKNTGKYYFNDFAELIDNFKSIENLDPTASKYFYLYNDPFGSLVLTSDFKKNFFNNLFKIDISDIFDIQAVLRLSGYINVDNNKEQKLENYKEAIATINNKKHAIEEKIGLVKFYNYPSNEQADKEGLFKKYISTPIFEAKSGIPANISWKDFLIEVDTLGYLSEEFYKQFENLNAAASVEQILFPEGKEDDIFSFFYRFKATTGLNVSQQNQQFVSKYESTYWWNIRDAIVNTENILEHVNKQALGPAGAIPGSEKDFTDWDPDNPVLCYLTGDSFASLNENITWFVDQAKEDGKSLKEWIETYYPLSGTSSTNQEWFLEKEEMSKLQNNDKLAKIEDKIPKNDRKMAGDNGKVLPELEAKQVVKVGEWDIIDPETGKMIVENAPKYIKVRNYWVDNDGETRKIDFGFWGDPDAAFKGLPYLGGAAFVKKKEKEFPGAKFNPHVRWSKKNKPKGPEFCSNGKSTVKISEEGEVVVDTSGACESNFWIPDGVFKWTRGAIQGGLISEKKLPLPIKTNIRNFNAYYMLSKMLSQSEAIDLRRLLEAFFIKEQGTIIALMHRSYVEESYPQIDSAFDTTIDTIMEALLSAVATANGDYAHLSSANSTSNAVSNPGIDFEGIVTQVLGMFVGAVANTVDPTWKTPWIWKGGPGPFTAWGIAAKILDEKGDWFSGSSGSDIRKPLYTCGKVDEFDNLIQEEVDIIDYDK